MRNTKVEKFELVNVRSDLHEYLRDQYTFIPPEFSEVVADAMRFVEAAIRNGFEAAFAESIPNVQVQHHRPFIEVVESLVDHHIRFVTDTDRKIARKSLLEAYIYIAGTRHVFGPTKKTQFIRTLRHSNPRKFAALLLSLHSYNLICEQIQDDIRRRMPDVKALELYMFNIETICGQIVTDAVSAEAVAHDDRDWVMAVIRRIEAQLLPPRSITATSRDLSIPIGYRK